MNPDQSSKTCALCGRQPKIGTTQHHLIPRQCHSNKWFKKRFSRQEMESTVPVCRPCHNAIHRFIPSHKELARNYNTLSKLLSHDQIATFVEWARKQR